MSSSPYTGLSSPTTIFSFPTEIIEQVIVGCALYGFPRSIASLAASCRVYRDVIYGVGDHHLWREIFLAVFDDPREALKIVKAPVAPVGCDEEGSEFDWRKEFQDRIRAEMVFKQEHSDGLDPNVLEQSLKAVLSAIATTTPILPNNFHHSSVNIVWLQKLFSHGFPEALIRRLSGQPSNGDNDISLYEQIIMRPEWEHTDAGKAFYKLFFLSGFRAISSAGENDGGERYNLRSSTKKRELLETRQRVLARTVARHRVYRLPYLSEDRCWGPFMPIRSDGGNEETVVDDAGDVDRKGKGKQVMRAEEAEEETESTSRTTRGKTRHQTATSSTAITVVDTPTSSDDVSISFIRAILSNFDVYFDSHHQIMVGVDEDEDDEEYVPPHQQQEDDDSTENNINDDADSTTSASNISETSSTETLATQTLFSPASGPVPIYPSQPHLLMPDYAFLSAARMVVAENLKERYGDGRLGDEPMWPWFTSAKAVRATGDVLERMGLGVGTGLPGVERTGEASTSVGAGTGVGEGGWECLRIGSSAAFWKGKGAVEGWGQSFAGDEAESEDMKGRTKAEMAEVDIPWKKEEGLEYVNGWDWAGAEGKWMRAVCWMDYRDLLFHNLQSSYSRVIDYHQEIQETCRVFPMTLKIVAYSRVPMSPRLTPPPTSSLTPEPGPSKTKPNAVPYDPLVYALPVIHIVGEFRGSDVDEHIARRARGTVRMIGDRAIRWNLISSEVNSPERDEWVMEGIQVGGVGSSMGVVGMWTGASHERGDPIGPSWAWKIE